jgi:hydrogenase-4 membrane subunit HyfE
LQDDSPDQLQQSRKLLLDSLLQLLSRALALIAAFEIETIKRDFFYQGKKLSSTFVKYSHVICGYLSIKCQQTDFLTQNRLIT